MKGLTYWEREITDLGYPELPLTEVTVLPNQSPAVQMRLDFFQIQSQFLKHVGHHCIQECFQIKLMREQILKLQDGIQPENTTIMFKIPPEYGGQLELDNLFLIQTHPHADTLYSFLQTQFQADHDSHTHKVIGEKSYPLPQTLFAFTPQGNVFIPALMGMVSPGGLNITDRMSEIIEGRE